MPKSTKPLVVPEHEYGDGTPTIGEIVLDMAQELLIDSLTQPNQLEVQRRRAKFVRQVNKTFAVELKEEVRKANAAQSGGRPRKDEQLLVYLGVCAEKIDGKLTVKNVTQEWANHSFELECPARNKLQELINLHSNLCSRPTH
jgi:hypothetical protein